MDSNAISGSDSLPSISSLIDLNTYTSMDSSLEMPAIRPELTEPTRNSRRHCRLPSISHLSDQSSPPIRLPDLRDSDLGVEAFVNSDDPTYPKTIISRPDLSPLRVSDAAPTAGNCNYPRSNHHGHSELIIIYGKRYDDEPYTEEEGDYILYAYCDRRRAWKEIVEEFTSMFGEKRRRTLGSLQTHFYLMNQRIPEWDKQGFLKFDNEHDLKPKQFSCKSRKVNVKHLGLGERYPERAIHYKWVEEADKIRWKDWAAKREAQYRKRGGKNGKGANAT